MLWVREEEGGSSERQGGGDDAAGVLEHGVPLPPPIKHKSPFCGFYVGDGVTGWFINASAFHFHFIIKKKNRKQPFINEDKISTNEIKRHFKYMLVKCPCFFFAS